MITTDNPPDFKKWILFNSGLENHKNLYDFYNAVKDVKSINESSCVSMQVDGSSKFKIENSAVPDALEITDDERHKILAYLRQHYFQTDDIHSWFRERQAKEDSIGMLKGPLDLILMPQEMGKAF